MTVFERAKAVVARVTAWVTVVIAWVNAVIAWVMKLKPVRVFTQYSERKGALLAGGLAYQAIFAVFAALWVGFAIASLVITRSVGIRQALIDLIATNVPGLIDTGNGGALLADDLFSATILGWTGAIAVVGLIFTAIGWLASGRDAVRVLFGLPTYGVNPILLKLKDLGLGLGFGVAMVVSAALSLASTSALNWLFSLVGIESASTTATIIARIVGFVLVLILDTAILAIFYRVVSGIRIPFRMLAQGTLIAAAGLGALMIAGSALLGGARNNPLLASFAVIIGLLIWFNLVCQVILLGASWIAVSADDAGLDLTGRRQKRTPTTTAKPVAKVEAKPTSQSRAKPKVAGRR